MSRCLQRFLGCRSSCAVVLSALAWGLLLPVVAQAQPDANEEDFGKPESPFLEIEGKSNNREFMDARDIWRSEENLSGPRAERFKNYFLKKQLPQMTQAFLRESLPDFRTDLHKDFRETEESRHIDKLNTHVAAFTYGVARGARLAKLKDGNAVYVYWVGERLYTLANKDVTDDVQSLGIPKKDFHPAVRYNAMRWLGELNSKKAKILAHRDGPKIGIQAIPYAKTFTLMLDIAAGKPYPQTLARFEKTEIGPAPDVVRIAALLGLKRHLVIDPNRNDSEKNLVIGEMLRLAEEQPDGMIREGATWYRQLALDIVGVIGFAGENAENYGRLDGILSNAEFPLPVRCSAANTLGQLRMVKVSDDVDLKLPEIARHLAQLAVDVCQDEMARAEFGSEPIAASRLMGSISDVLVAFQGPRIPEDAKKKADDETAQLSGILAFMDEEAAETAVGEIVNYLKVVQRMTHQAALNPESKAAATRLKRGVTKVIAKLLPDISQQ